MNEEIDPCAEVDYFYEPEMLEHNNEKLGECTECLITFAEEGLNRDGLCEDCEADLKYTHGI